jgi:hypothetical protein
MSLSDCLIQQDYVWRNMTISSPDSLTLSSLHALSFLLSLSFVRYLLDILVGNFSFNGRMRVLEVLNPVL